MASIIGKTINRLSRRD